jgi:class 3 adenylate cyclase
LTIDENLVSREHAIIFFDATMNRWCISDLGSKNGTYVDGRRVGQVMALGNTAEIKVGRADLEFVSTMKIETGADQSSMTHTLFDSRSENMWLLLADIRDSTKLMQILPPGELQMKIHAWIDQCRPLLARSEGQINEFVGDGFVAFWRESEIDIQKFSRCMLDFESMVVQSGVDFRMIVHYGEVMTGIGVSSSLEKITGPTLNFMFKCEKAVRDTTRRLVFSEAAKAQLKENIPLEPAITCLVPGFEGKYNFYTLAGGSG